ncbi:CPBP family intramembrane glutamic endopeptidase [Colwellia hornerae]|uniref:CPBP family intramembrane metalloprotease n=1 Tax=Colwellia hornerae TaxID=89402 RepID=A0A5C6Q6S2_9GAMM|nr:type II CAAX endopeptidase family protein [Colwellia hornerae]TWX49223.1 CPBP family intramembrane metalloprotease [Colwellia hornerae]TWX55815.1 CPBP family intramembrane metalloprotease [Colwellia hornerae]TWX64685.1 CPBP family intramembrane metalloprotease [Colwellia hornerae]
MNISKVNHLSGAVNKVMLSILSMLSILLLALVLPVFSTFIVFISGLGSIFLDEVHTIEQLNMNLGFNFTTSIVSVFLMLPLLQYYLSTKNKESIVNRLALKSITLTRLIMTLLAVLTFSLFEYFIFSMGIVETPSFMLDFLESIDTGLEITLLILTVGIVGPFIEEIIFRGIAFYKLEQISLNPIIIIVITSLAFTLIHSQYQQTEVFILLFLSSCLLGSIRYVSGNLWYCIFGHMVMNIIVVAESFL